MNYKEDKVRLLNNVDHMRNTLGNLLKEHSILELSQLSNLSYFTIYSFVHNEHTPHYKTLIKLEQLLNTVVDKCKDEE